MSFLSDWWEAWNRRKDIMTFSIQIVIAGIFNKSTLFPEEP